MIKQLLKVIIALIVLIYYKFIWTPYTWTRWYLSRKYRIYVWEQIEGKKWKGGMCKGKYVE